MNLHPFIEVWTWTATSLSRASIYVPLLIMLLALSCIAAMFYYSIKIYFSKQLEDACEKLNQEYWTKFRANGLPGTCVSIVAKACASFFVAKVFFEVLEPFVMRSGMGLTTQPAFGGMSVYDATALSFLILIFVGFWMSFCGAVKAHDMKREGKRKRTHKTSRAHGYYLRPASVGLLLVIIPDVGKLATRSVAELAFDDAQRQKIVALVVPGSVELPTKTDKD